MKIILIIGIVLSTALLALGQDFETYYQEAADNNPQLKAIFNEYYAIRERTAQVQLPPPTAALGVFILPVETRLGAQRFKLGLSQMFPAFGSLKARRALISKQAALKLQQAEVIRNELYFGLRDIWFQVMEINALTIIEKENIELLEVLERLALQKVEIGKGSLANVYQVKIKINERKNNIGLLQNKLPYLHASFAQILNRDSLPELETSDTVALRNLNFPKDSLRNWIQFQNPSLQIIELKKEAARQKMEVQRTKNRPTYGVGLDYVFLTPRTDANPPQNGQGVIMPMFKISVPIYKKQNQARIKEVEFELMALDDNQEHLRNVLDLQLEMALTKYRDSQLKINLYKEQIDFTKKTLELLMTNYSVAAEDFDEVLKIEQMLFKYQKLLVQTSISQNKSIITIEKLFAQPLVK